MAERYRAILQWLGGDLGYGFLIERDNQKVVIRYDPIPGEGFRVLMEGYVCAFEVVDGPKGLTAARVYQPDIPVTRHIDRSV